MALAFALSFTLSREGDAWQPLRRHWRVTDSETLWTGRYNNCDYGYYVLLPSGVVGHDTPPPSPNHGFLIALPDVGTMEYALDRKGRFVWVDASYNSSDSHSLSDLVHAGDIGEKIPTTMAGLSAVQVRSASGVGASRVVEVATVALRAGIIYTVALRTNGIDATGDEAVYRRIILGFKLLPLPRGQCSNG